MLLLLVSVALGRAPDRPLDLSGLNNTDVFPEVPGRDAVCLRGPGRPELPLFVDLPVTEPISGIAVTLYQTDARPAAGVAAILSWTYADGSTGRSFAAQGRQSGPGAVEGRLTEAVLLGSGPDGSARVGNRWTIPARAAGSMVTRARLETRLANTSVLCVTAAETVEHIPLSTATDTHDWYPFTISSRLASAIPQSAPIEAPVGTHGALTRGADGHFVFEDGTRTRFWGINLVGSAAIPKKEEADNLAAELAKLGFNLARLHHIDVAGANGVLNPKRTADPTTWLDPAQTDRLDFFISRLQAHGLYIYAEVATMREFNAQDGVSNPGGMPNGHKLASMWAPDWQAAYLEWFGVFWNRTNPYTGLRYPEDPGVAMVELSNEHSLLMHWGLGLEGLPPAQLSVLDGRWNEWLKTRYPSDEAMRSAWSAGVRFDGLRTGETLGSVMREPKLPNAFDHWPMQRRKDLFEFYRGLEEDFYKAVADKARKMGFRVPLVPSIVYDQPILQYLYRSYDMADTHIAWDSIDGMQFDNVSVLRRPEMILSYAATAVMGQAMGVTELNHPFPNEFRAEAPLLWAAFLSNQDWDSPVWFSWLDGPWSEDDSTVVGSFDLRSNTVALAQMPSASTLFRTYALPTAEGFAPYNVDPDVLLSAYLGDQHLRPQQLKPLEVLDLGYVLTHRVRSSFEHTPPATVDGAAPPGLGWWSNPGVLLLEQPTVLARVGPPAAALQAGFGIQTVKGLDVNLKNWAAVSLVSTDGKPIGQAQSALLTVATRQENSGQRFGAQGTELVQWGGPPVLVEPARGSVVFSWPGRPEVHPLDQYGVEMPAIAVRKVRQGWSIELDSVKSPWLHVRTPLAR